MGALSGNSVLPFNINNPAILISLVGLRLRPPPKKKHNAKEFCRTRHATVTPRVAPPPQRKHRQAQGPSRKPFQLEDKDQKVI